MLELWAKWVKVKTSMLVLCRSLHAYRRQIRNAFVALC